MEAIYLLDHSLTLPVVNELNLKGSNIFRLFLIYWAFHKSASLLLQRRRNMVLESFTARIHTCRVAKCHGYDGYIHLNILTGWGKRLGEYENMVLESFTSWIHT